MDTLSQPALSSARMSSMRPNAAADRQRHEDLLGRPPDHVDHDVAAFMAGRDVEKHQFVGPFFLVARRDLDRIPGVAQVDEIDALDHPAAIDVQTGNDAFCQHVRPLDRISLPRVGTIRVPAPLRKSGKPRLRPSGPEQAGGRCSRGQTLATGQTPTVSWPLAGSRNHGTGGSARPQPLGRPMEDGAGLRSTNSTLGAFVRLLLHHFAIGQRFDEQAAVRLGAHAGVEQHDDAVVSCERISRPKPCLSLITASGSW